MATQQKAAAAAGLIVIVGVSIALRQATVANGAVLGLSPLVALALVSGAAIVVPKMVRLS